MSVDPQACPECDSTHTNYITTRSAAAKALVERLCMNCGEKYRVEYTPVEKWAVEDSGPFA